MNIIIAILIFGLVIIFHEFGHFILAKKNGITVTEFSLGMGPRLASFVKGGTRYSLKLFPIGGSCMMLGEDEEVSEQGSFNSKGVWARISVIAAGPIFNFILAFFLSLIMVGMIGYDSPYITEVSKEGPAMSAGLQKGDIITAINGSKIHFGREIQMYYYFHDIKPQDELEIRYQRDGQNYSTKLVTQQKELYQLGFTYVQNEAAAEIEEIAQGGALEAAGFKAGDIITAINKTPIASGKELSIYFNENPLNGSPITIEYTRNNLDYSIEVTPNLIQNYMTTGFNYNLASEKTKGFGIIKYSFYEVKYWISSTIKSLGMMIRGKVSTSDLGGPVRIVSEIGKVVDTSKKYGIQMLIVQLINWSVLLSANLGVMNLIPIPALDGGRLLFLLIEAVRGKPIDREKEAYVHMAGFVMLMVLMVFVFYNDLRNLFF